MNITLRERIKAALDAPCGAIDFGGVGRELLTLVLAEMESKDIAVSEWERLRAELISMTAMRDDARNNRARGWEYLRADLAAMTAERDAMLAALHGLSEEDQLQCERRNLDEPCDVCAPCVARLTYISARGSQTNMRPGVDHQRGVCEEATCPECAMFKTSNEQP
jgi:hypothetical protein